MFPLELQTLLTVRRDPSVWLLEELSPVQIQGVQPWRVSTLFELFCVNVSILLLHRGEARYAQVWQVLAVLAAVKALLSSAGHLVVLEM